MNYCCCQSATKLRSHLYRFSYDICQESGRAGKEGIVPQKYLPHVFSQTPGFHTKQNKSHTVQFHTAVCCRWCPKNMFVYFASLQAPKLLLRMK